MSTPFQRTSPAWFRMLNKVWKSSYTLGTRIRLDKDTLIMRARKATGLRDLGSDFNEGPLDRLLLAMEQEATLHAAGRFITRERMVSLLSIRLRAEYYFKKYPQILQQELYPAWIIVGLQRTGTTKLQRLLAVDPNHRVIPSWEVINPIPLNLELYSPTHQFTSSPTHPLTYPSPRDKRIGVARTSVNALKLMSPGFFAVHPIDAMQPEEDILLLDVSFLSTTPEAMTLVPEYSAWLEQTDQSEAYAYAVKLLKFMQWIRPARRWILKSPHHLEFTGLIRKHFNEVHFIWPHRNIYESVPSFLSMLTYNHMVFCEGVDERKIAAHWVRKTGYMLDRALTDRMEGENDSSFTDVWYKDLVTDSQRELHRIYSMDGGITPALSEEFMRHESEHHPHRHGKHNYSLADFGLTETDIDHYTNRYREFLTKRYG